MNAPQAINAQLQLLQTSQDQLLRELAMSREAICEKLYVSLAGLSPIKIFRVTGVRILARGG